MCLHSSPPPPPPLQLTPWVSSVLSAFCKMEPYQTYKCFQFLKRRPNINFRYLYVSLSCLLVRNLGRDTEKGVGGGPAFIRQHNTNKTDTRIIYFLLSLILKYYLPPPSSPPQPFNTAASHQRTQTVSFSPDKTFSLFQ